MKKKYQSDQECFLAEFISVSISRTVLLQRLEHIQQGRDWWVGPLCSFPTHAELYGKYILN